MFLLNRLLSQSVYQIRLLVEALMCVSRSNMGSMDAELKATGRYSRRLLAEIHIHASSFKPTF